MIRKHFRLKRIALGLALATAVVAPTAQAAVYVDGPTPANPGRIHPGRGAPADRLARCPFSRRSPPQLRSKACAGRQWHKASTRTSLASLPRAQRSRTRSTPRLPVPITQALTTSVSDGGFNWSDAGIGASVSFGAALLLLTAVGLGRRSRSRGLASV